jgi:hypothetical protein
MPGPSSGVPMNSMPAASRADFKAIKFARVVVGTPSPVSALVIVLVLTSELSANSLTDQRSAFLAILI